MNVGAVTKKQKQWGCLEYNWGAGQKHEDVKHQFSLTGRQLLPSSVLAHSQSRVNSVRVTEGRKGAIGRGLRDRAGPTVGRNMLEVWGWGSPKRGGGLVIHPTNSLSIPVILNLLTTLLFDKVFCLLSWSAHDASTQICNSSTIKILNLQDFKKIYTPVWKKAKTDFVTNLKESRLHYTILALG